MLERLLEGLTRRGPVPDVDVSGATTDSRLVEEGDLFVALSGKRFDGRDFIFEAARRGARAALSERPPKEDLPIPAVHVPGLRDSLALLSRRLYGGAAAGLRPVGVTGTNGKTTLSFLLKKALGDARCGVIGTVEYDLLAWKMKAFLTTPQVVEIWRFLAGMRGNGAEFCAMEVSSQGLHMGRVEGVPFAAAVFTNLSREHLDYHGSMEEYFRAKASLFRTLQPGAVAVANLDDPWGREILKETKARRVGVALGAAPRTGAVADALYKGGILSESPQGMVLRVKPPDGDEFDIATPLVGAFNAMNVVEAAACALELGVERAEVVEALEQFGGAPGRFERVDAGQGFTVLVDYAHTPDALEKALSALREICPGRLLVVFGCGGDRDRGKRPAMGKIASRTADVVVVTSDNPRSERPEDIIEEILSGVEGPAEIIVEPDRREAIRTAVRLAGAGDVLLIAGKGHEDYQEAGGIRRRMDDREEARKALEEAGWGMAGGKRV